MKLLVIVPAYNEIDVLEKNVMRLHSYLGENLSVPFAIAISAYRFSPEMDEAGKRIAEKTKNIFYYSTPKRGRGIALVEAHKRFAENGDWVGYIDLDLPVNLEKFKEVEKLIAGNSCDLVIGCRYGKGSIKGPMTRKMLSQGYIMLANLVLFGGFKVPDFQAGFKFWKKEALDEMLMRWGSMDEKWFFDTQMVYYANVLGKKTEFLPIDYSLAENRKSTVKGIKDSVAFFSNLIRFRLGKKY